MALAVLAPEPVNKYEEVGILASFFAFSLALLGVSWKLIRARTEAAIDQPHLWRLTEYVVCGEAVVCGVYLLLALYTAQNEIVDG